ncbi:MAG: ACP S-malonyltransferase, partial [Chloroflexota bacterium]
MGASLWQCSPAAKAVFAEADRATGLPLKQVCFEGPSDRLTDTAFAQPGVVATSLAAAEALRERLSKAGKAIEPTLCAGHSVGELAALARAGALSTEDCFRLVAARGKLMAEASALADGSMVAVLGLDEPVLMKLCEMASQETGASVQVANLNAPGQIVLSGNRKALGKASELARSSGARRVIELDVSGPFHSVYMQPAADGFRAIVEGTQV